MSRRWIIFGLLAMAVGVVWFLQGTDVLAGGAMSGKSFWMWVGLILIAAGGAAVFRGARSGRGRSS